MTLSAPAYGVSFGANSLTPAEVSWPQSCVSRSPISGRSATHSGGGGTRNDSTVPTRLEISSVLATMVPTASQHGTIRTISSASVMTSTAMPRRLPA